MRKGSSKEKLTVWFEEIGKEDIPLVGGKVANLGEMLQAGIPVPPGFAVTAQAYKKFITKTGIAEKIYKQLRKPLPTLTFPSNLKKPPKGFEN